jgi:hypothetical protein
VFPIIYPRRNILATNGKELHQTVNKIAYNYFNRLRRKKKEGNKMDTPQKQHTLCMYVHTYVCNVCMYAAWIQACDLEHQYIN